MGVGMVASIEQLSYPFQITGFWFTVAGTALALAGLVWAIIAAKRAKGAREQAGEARDAAIRLGRVTQLGDLIGEMQELQTMLARADFGAVTSKSNQLRGRVVRFKEEAYTELGEVEMEKLDLAREQLTSVVEFLASSKGQEEFKVAQIQKAYGNANEALNFAVARHGQSEESSHGRRS